MYLSQFPMEVVVYVILENYLNWVRVMILVRTQLDGEVFHSSDLHSKLLYDTFLEIRSSLQISSLSVQRRDKWMTIPYPITSRYNLILFSFYDTFLVEVPHIK